MNTGTTIICWQKWVGLLAMILLTLALFSLADALIGGFKGSSGTIELLPGDRFQISGPLPPRTEKLEEFVLEGQPSDKSVQIIPDAIFSGYWFGGPMWRGIIQISPYGREGAHTIRIKDRFGEKQNPALVFSIRVWPDLATKNANSLSIITRQSGYPPFAVAAFLAICGALAGAINFMLGVQWSKHLAAHHCGEIFRIKRSDKGSEVTCDLHGSVAVIPGMTCTIFRPMGELICSARIINHNNNEISLFIPEKVQISLGDVACFGNPDATPETAAIGTPEHVDQ